MRPLAKNNILCNCNIIDNLPIYPFQWITNTKVARNTYYFLAIEKTPKMWMQFEWGFYNKKYKYKMKISLVVHNGNTTYIVDKPNQKYRDM